MAKEVQIEGHPYLVKDTTTGAILNKDKAGLAAYKRQKALLTQKEDKIAKLEADVAELKALVHLLVQDKK